MPGRNGRGPLGEGPMTGRRMGRCGADRPAVKGSETAPAYGPGFGGRGHGWRHRRCHCATGVMGWQRAQLASEEASITLPTPMANERRLAALRQEAATLEKALGALEAGLQAVARDARGRETK